MRPRILVSALATTAVLAGLAACGAPGTSSSGKPSDVDLSSPAKKEGTLTVVTKFADPKYAPYFEQIAKDYEAANPDVTVDLQQVGDQPYKDKIRVLAASKELPDVYFSWAGDFANKFVRAGLAADLSEVLAPDTEWGKTFSPAALRAFETDGKYYGVPIDLDAKFMAYNTAIFDKVDIKAPQTLEDMIADCGKLSDAGYTPIGFGNQYGWPAIHYITQLNAYNVPAEVRNTDYNPASGEFTDPGYVTALEQFKQIADACFVDGTNGLSHEAGQAEFLNSKAGMHYLESVEFQALTAKGGAPAELADNWSFFRLPPAADSAGDTNAITGAPDGFMVNAQSKQAALAVDFLKFMTSQENAAKMVEQIGWLSPVQGTATAENSFPQLEDALADISKADDFAIWLDTVTDADVANAYLSGVQGILDGSNDPEGVMEDVQKAAEKAKQQAD
ncbi:MAG: extracellular solute-binding protein [Nocardioides sp.]|uniref:ABC transporter substrate-binding protein n=1 Tax=Nocardioides sp. TaxID=35761 RepID=UPI0039E5EB4D